MKSNPKLTALQVELAQVQHEIETLIDTLTEGNRNDKPNRVSSSIGVKPIHTQFGC